MTLTNLPGISLDAVAADKVLVGMLIAAAERNPTRPLARASDGAPRQG